MKTIIRFITLLLLSMFLPCFSLPCQAEILSSDYSSIGDILVYDYELTKSSYMEVFQKTKYVGNRIYEYYKTYDGLRVEKIHRVCDDGVNVEELFRYIPINKENLKTLEGEVVIFLYQYDGNKIQTIDGTWIDTFSEDGSLVEEENLYTFYTLDGRGVVCYEEYGVEGDINYIYLLANEEQPKYQVTLLPDSQWGKLTEWANNEYPTEHISLYGTSGEYITLPECTYEKNGYTFDHWWDDSQAYYPGEKYRIPNRDCTLNAVWLKDFTVTLDSQHTRQGDTVTLTVSIQDNPGMIGGGLTMNYDSGKFTFQSASGVEIFKNADIHTETVSKDTVSVEWNSSGQICKGDGDILTLKFTVNEDIPDGAYKFTVCSPVLYTSENKKLHADDASGNLIVHDGIMGDVNKDGKTDETDLTLLKQYFAGWANAADSIIDRYAADINMDGEFTRSDLMILARCFAFWENYSLDILFRLPIIQ